MSTSESSIICERILDTVQESSEVTTRDNDVDANQSSMSMSESSTIICERVSNTAEGSSEVTTRDNNDATANQLSMNMSESSIVICESIHDVIQESSKVTTRDNGDTSVNQSSQTQESTNKESSLDIIAQQYKNFSDEEETDDKETDDQDASIMKEQTLQQYRTNVIKELSSETSSSEESDSEEDSNGSSSSSSTDDSDNYDDSTTKNVNNNDIIHNKQEKSKTKKAKQKEIENELDMLPPIEDLRISVPEDTCIHLGQVAWIVEQLVVVKPRLDAPTLDLDTVLFLEKGQKVLGKIFDVFGSVKETHYCVRFNSSTHIEENGIKVNMPVYFCSDTSYTFIVFWHELIKIKGWDVDDLSGEPPDFSDDEKEQDYYAKLRPKKKARNNTKNSVGNNNTQESLQQTHMCNERPSFRHPFVPPQVRNANPTKNAATSRWQSNHPWSKSGKNQKCTIWRNRAQNGTYAHWPQSPMDQSNVYQPQYNPRNLHLTYNKTQRYCAPFNAPQDCAYQFPSYPFDAYSSIPPTFNSVSQYSNNVQYSNVPFSQMSYPMQPYLSHIPTYPNTSWPSTSLSQLPLSPPPPPPSVLSIPAPPPSDRTNEYN